MEKRNKGFLISQYLLCLQVFVAVAAERSSTVNILVFSLLVCFNDVQKELKC